LSGPVHGRPQDVELRGSRLEYAECYGAVRESVQALVVLQRPQRGRAKADMSIRTYAVRTLVQPILHKLSAEHAFLVPNQMFDVVGKVGMVEQISADELVEPLEYEYDLCRSPIYFISFSARIFASTVAKALVENDRARNAWLLEPTEET